MYLKYFGFREAPFNLTPDPKFYFSSLLHREAFAALYYGIKSKKGFIVVTGEVGTGKTTLLRKLLRSLEVTHHSVFIFNTLLTFDELLAYAVRDLGLEPAGTGRAALIQQLNEFLLENTKKGHTVSLLIDEAQQLSEETLESIRFLSNLETDREKLIQIILVGQPELEAKLNQPSLRQLKQRVSLWSRLDRLNAKDTEAYIRHRLEVAGYQGPDIFDAPAIKLIAAYAFGTPRLINSICDNALLTTFAMSKKVVSEQIVQEVIHDLRLIPSSEAAKTGLSERERSQQSSLTALSNDVESSEPNSGARGRAVEDHAGGLRTNRQSVTPRESELGYDFGLKRDRSDVRQIAHDQKWRRTPARNVSIFTELKEKRSEERGRINEVAEGSKLYAAAGNRAPLTLQSRSTPARADAIVPPGFFDKLVQILTNAMGPMAGVVWRDQIAALGESPEQFPINRIGDLLEAIKREILSDGLRLKFEEEVAAQIRQLSTRVS